jgi:hypothetical protein
MPFPYPLKRPITSCKSSNQAAARIISSRCQPLIEAMLFPNAFSSGELLQSKTIFSIFNGMKRQK